MKLKLIAWKIVWWYDVRNYDTEMFHSQSVQNLFVVYETCRPPPSAFRIWWTEERFFKDSTLTPNRAVSAHLFSCNIRSNKFVVFETGTPH